MRKKLIFLCSVLLFGSCFQVKSIKPEEDQKLMISRIEEFHRLYNEQRFEEIADTLYEPDFLQARGKDEIIGDLEHIYRKCGKVINAEFSSRPTIYSGGGTRNRAWFVVLRTDFEKGINYRETLLFVINTEVYLALIKVNNDSGFLVDKINP